MDVNLRCSILRNTQILPSSVVLIITSFIVQQSVLVAPFLLLAVMEISNFVRQINKRSWLTIWQEATTAIINLKDDDPQAVNRMLLYLYNDDYLEGTIPWTQSPLRTTVDPAESTKPPHLRGFGPPVFSSNHTLNRPETITSPVTNNALVYAIADKYDVLGLKDLAKFKFHFCLKGLTSYNELGDLIGIVYTTIPSSDKGLRNLVADHCSKNFKQITINQAVKEAFRENGELSFAVLEQFTASGTSDHNRLEKAMASEAILQVDLSRAKLVLMHLRARRHSLELQVKDLESQAAVSRQTLQVFDTLLYERLTKANDWDECRQCGEDASFTFDWKYPLRDLKIQLRSDCCNTRHDIGAGIFRDN